MFHTRIATEKAILGNLEALFAFEYTKLILIGFKIRFLDFKNLFGTKRSIVGIDIRFQKKKHQGVA